MNRIQNFNSLNIARAFKGFQYASKAAKAFQIAHGVALGCAAASLAAGGVMTIMRLRKKE